jgi:hypothetical protein
MAGSAAKTIWDMLCANLATSNATDEQLSAVRSPAHQRRAARGRPPGWEKKKGR